CRLLGPPLGSSLWRDSPIRPLVRIGRVPLTGGSLWSLLHHVQRGGGIVHTVAMSHPPKYQQQEQSGQEHNMQPTQKRSETGANAVPVNLADRVVPVN